MQLRLGPVALLSMSKLKREEVEECLLHLRISHKISQSKNKCKKQDSQDMIKINSSNITRTRQETTVLRNKSQQ